LSGGFWRGKGSRIGWIWTGLLLLALIFNAGVQLLMNVWNGWFFNALEKKDIHILTQAAYAFLGLVVLVASAGVFVLIARETLQVRWREWLTGNLMRVWLDHKRYYHLSTDAQSPANPEYRIADDVRMAIEPIVDFVIGLFSALLSTLIFVSILWSIGGHFRFESGLTIPAYFVVAALLHGVIASSLIMMVGHSLIHKVSARNEAEAHLRFNLMRVRHEAQSIADAQSESETHHHLKEIYALLVTRWLRVVRKCGHLTWITNGNGALNPVVPLLLAAPKYLSGDLTLGDVTQITAAYIHVQAAVTWFVENYRRIAECYASCGRVVALANALDMNNKNHHPITDVEPIQALRGEYV
jgi:putative ATP-binding cassette transporter